MEPVSYTHLDVYKRQLYNSLIEKAIDSLRRAKELHGQVEEHYIPAIDFSKVDEKCAAILEEIQGY